MLDIIKKSYETTINNPTILVFWTAYMFVMPVCFNILINAQGLYLFILVLMLMIVLNSAFFAGWFAMIKKAVENSDKEYSNADERYEDMLKLNGIFFSSIPSYIIPMLAIFAIYVLGFALWLKLAFVLAERFIGDLDFLLESLPRISSSTAELVSYFQSLPIEQLKVVYGWQMFILGAISIFGILTLFLPPALYFEKNNQKNPFLAFFDSAKTLFKRPLGVIGFCIVIQFLSFVLMLTQGLCMYNILLYFIYLVIFIYITVFMIVLLFNYYDKRFANNCCNRSDCIGQDKNLD